MKKNILLLFAGFIAIFLSCNNRKNQYDIPKIIIVAGKIDNYDPSRELTLYVNRIGFKQEPILAKTDSAGNFMATFESYIPVDAWVSYHTNFQVLLHPGDSLFVYFDGKYNNRPEILESIKFGGNAAKTNQYAAKYQQMYYSNELYTNWDKKQKAVKEYDANQYVQYLDTIRQECKEIYNRFVSENNPDAESKKWVLLRIDNDYYYDLSWYAFNRRQVNQGNFDWDNSWNVPKGFYDRLCERLPIDASMFINSAGLSSFHNTFYRYVDAKMKDSLGEIAVTPVNYDSIRIFSIIEYVPDPLLIQIMLTEMLSQYFERENITAYESYHDVVETYIKEPFLKEPLAQKYLQTKHRIENPQVYTASILEDESNHSLQEAVNLSLQKAVNLSAKQIFDEIFQQNKSKVIYIDFWGTWCGPCLAELPNSKIVEHEFENEDVVFIYICFESEEEQWKATLDKFKLGGQHYHLSNRQSAEMRNLLRISGLPFYMLIDKNGIITENGNHLRPLYAKDKIKEMLK